MAASLSTAAHHPCQGLAIHQHCPAGQSPKAFLADKVGMSGNRMGEGKIDRARRGGEGKEKGRREKWQVWCRLGPTGAGSQMDTQHAYADLELEVLCLAGGVPGPSSCSISGSMIEGCSGVAALLPWRVE